MKKCIFVNLIILILLLCGVEGFLFFKDRKILSSNAPYSLKKEDFSMDSLKREMRKPVGLNYKKLPVIIYGCSFAYGLNLSPENTFGSILSEYTKRPVYNFAVTGKGMQHALFLLQNDKKITPDPEYVFYVFITDHVRRMYINCNVLDSYKYLTYRNDNGKLVQNDNNWDLCERFFITKKLKNASFFVLKKVFDKQMYELTKLYFLEMQNAVKKQYPSAKFVVLTYQLSNYRYITKERIKDLNKSGIEVISLNDLCEGELIKPKYKIPKEQDYFQHPNKEAWEKTVKEITKKLNL